MYQDVSLHGELPLALLELAPVSLIVSPKFGLQKI